MKTALTESIGLGSALKNVIGATMAVAPMPASVKRAIMGCAGCTGRARRLDSMVSNINPLARAKVYPVLIQPPTQIGPVDTPQNTKATPLP